MTERYRNIQPIVENTPLIITQDFVNILDELSNHELPITSDQREQRYLQEQELSDLARNHHQGSSFLNEYLPQRITYLLQARSNGHSSLAIQDELGIQLPEDPAIQKERTKKLSAYGLPETQEDLTHEISVGVFSAEGAKTYELEHLIRTLPEHITWAISSGNIREAEDTQKKLDKWDTAFYMKYNEHYFREENLHSVLKTPYRVEAWKNSKNIPSYQASI